MVCRRAFFSFSIKTVFYLISVQEAISNWFQLPLDKKEAKIWRAAPLYSLWIIWKERTLVVFKNEAFSIDRVRSSFIYYPVNGPLCLMIQLSLRSIVSLTLYEVVLGCFPFLVGLVSIFIFTFFDPLVYLIYTFF